MRKRPDHIELPAYPVKDVGIYAHWLYLSNLLLHYEDLVRAREEEEAFLQSQDDAGLSDTELFSADLTSEAILKVVGKVRVIIEKLSVKRLLTTYIY
jgi:hypothetical protein